MTSFNQAPDIGGFDSTKLRWRQPIEPPSLVSLACVAASECNTVLATVTTLHGSSSSPSSPALTVTYSERSHAAGRIPSTLSRRDNQQPGESETLGPGSCNSFRPPTTNTPSSLSPRTPPSRPCTLADEKWEVLSTSGAGCVRVALFKDERRGGGEGGR